MLLLHNTDVDDADCRERKEKNCQSPPFFIYVKYTDFSSLL
jgi:hypothetical protein